jgi:hypothetical protein
MNSVKHYYLHDDKSGNEALYQGFRWLKQHSANTGGLIAVPALGNLERYASLQHLRHGIDRPILVLHPTKEFLEKVLHIRDLSAMFVISYDKPN